MVVQYFLAASLSLPPNTHHHSATRENPIHGMRDRGGRAIGPRVQMFRWVAPSCLLVFFCDVCVCVGDMRWCQVIRIGQA